jgi:hypothetical protein
MTLNPGDILKGDFWPEPVRVLTVTPVGERFKIEAVGTKSQPQQFYSRILSKDDIDRVVIDREVGQKMSPKPTWAMTSVPLPPIKAFATSRSRPGPAPAT